MSETNNTLKFIFLGCSFLFWGSVIASESFFVPHELLIACLVGLFLYQIFFPGRDDRCLTPFSRTWLLVLLVFFILNILPSMTHAVMDMAYGDRLKQHVENILHLAFFAIWFFLAVKLNVSVLQLWKFLILSVIWVFWVLFYETYTLNGFENLSSFIVLHRYGDVGSIAPINFGIYANTLFLILLGGVFWFRKLGWGWILALLVALAIALTGSILSQSRTAWIGWPEAIIAWTVFYSYYLWRNQKKGVLFGGAVTVIAVVILLTQSSLYSLVEKRAVKAITDVEDYIDGRPLTSLGQRFVMYEAGWNSFKEHPLIGVGPDGFPNELKKQTESIFSEQFGIQNKYLSFGHIHNQFLMSAMENGILGVLSLIFLFLYLFVVFIQQAKNLNYYSKSLGVVGLVFMIASFLTFMPEVPLYRRDPFLFFFFVTSLLLVMLRAPMSDGKK
ncbi:hypothetical protein AVO42_10610 [Thiomicrospira sp. XS5]|uniref:O-antigen ligase family protein n=1 Tax=Thiomicrospira sp. XS5 TaxID=1775636 RepID=UPI000746F91C|nr:O-antigen ligase family protein [Thiomicrospira sp. XS5]KUJ75728.1 hypothetical protein AVO42_10610 [Thiomicrospira sp. XS5]